VLALTHDAAEVIREIVETTPEAAARSGLRIATESTDSEGADLSMSIVEGPEAGDETVEMHGATVYVAESASELLADKVLDAHAHDDHVHFTIGEQDASD
jgi:iron-sulfur cluster assembly protein